MQDLYPFSNAPYAFAYKYEDNHVKDYVAFSANSSGIGFSESQGQKNLEDWLRYRFFATNIRPALYAPGRFYKRMWRPPGYLPRQLLAPDLKTLTQSALSVELLIDRMQELFATVEPSSRNIEAFGHKIREILLLACMEVEASWVGVLKEHGYIRNHYTTKDYVKLIVPMCLEDYQVQLRWYPDFPSFKPFERWDSSKPTQSIVWYDAYNATKHNREANLHKATLVNAIHAVGASVVMFCAQFGMAEDELLTKSIYSMFDIKLDDKCPERSYIPYGRASGVFPSDWTPIKHSF
ncbi:hypothetical protein H6F90_04895 [Trichocoleus sp. FACHB-591]|uniref:hypothetical protein n=1 Tax=Trichocoleus sp. FACHB-591 TaxID=2692872 RepID=UPI0016831EFC|nr:hypothetical protein [Trichocoleus sp. FACHB-591]MBD2094487.1 hypothetical protein [Trichocoleus sp. FACHB-591]